MDVDRKKIEKSNFLFLRGEVKMKPKKRMFMVIAAVVMTAGVIHAAEAPAGKPDDELDRAVKETTLALAAPLVNETPYSTFCVGHILFPGVSDEALKSKLAAHIIDEIYNALASMDGKATLLDDRFVWSTLKAQKQKPTTRHEALTEETIENAVKELQTNWVINGSVEDGMFKITFTPMDWDGGGGMPIEDQEKFDPGASEFFAEARDGWSPGPKPELRSWIAPGQITCLSFDADGKKLAVGSHDEQGARVQILDPHTRKIIGQITPVARRVNDVFYTKNHLLLAALNDRVEVYDGASIKLAIHVAEDEPVSVVSAGGKILVTGKRGFVGVYDQKTWEPVNLPQKFNTRGQTTMAAVSPDQAFFGVCAGDKAFIFSTTTLQLKQTITGTRTFNTIGFLGNDNRLSLATDNGVEEYDITGKYIRTVAQGDQVNAIEHSTNAILSVIGGPRLRLYKGSTLIFTLYDGRQLDSAVDEITTIAYSPAYMAAAHGNSLEIFASVAEPHATVTVKNDSNYTATVIVDDGAPVEIVPAGRRQFGMIIRGSQQTVNVALEDEENDSVYLTESKITVRPGNEREVTVMNNTSPKATLSREGRLEVAALTATGDAVIAAYPPISRGKTSRVTAEIVLLDLKTGLAAFLKPHQWGVMALAANSNYIVSAGADKNVHVYDSAGYKYSFTTGDTPISIDIDDGNRLLLVYEDGLSVINLTGFTATENPPPKKTSVIWNNQELDMKAVSTPPRKNTMEAALPNGRTVIASDYISLNRNGKELAAFALFSTMEWALVAHNGRYVGSALSGNHLQITEGPNKPRQFTSRDAGLFDHSKVRVAMAEFVKR
jgi:WD40 repeat protein